MKPVVAAEYSHELENIHMIRGEVALVFAVLIDSLGVDLMIHSLAGVSAISSLPYSFSLVLPFFSLGTWTYIFQGLLVLSLMLLRKKFVPAYLGSFVVGFAFGKMLDIFEIWLSVFPEGIPYRILYFVVSYILICIGIAISNRCKLPIVPTDLFPRELSDITGLTYSRIKIAFDVICLTVSAVMTGICLGHIEGLGIGTILAAFTMGKVIGMIGEELDKRCYFTSFLEH